LSDAIIVVCSVNNLKSFINSSGMQHKYVGSHIIKGMLFLRTNNQLEKEREREDERLF